MVGRSSKNTEDDKKDEKKLKKAKKYNLRVEKGERDKPVNVSKTNSRKPFMLLLTISFLVVVYSRSIPLEQTAFYLCYSCFLLLQGVTSVKLLTLC